MNKDHIKDFSSHPLFLSFVLWIILILSIPVYFSKYRIEIVSEEYIPENRRDLFSDLDSDGVSERLSFDFADAGQTKIIISRDSRVSDQFNLRYQPVTLNSVHINDYNNDQNLECYVFTLNKDSIFLNIIDPFGPQKEILTDRFIDLWSKAPNSIDKPHIVPVGFVSNESYSKDFIFYISAGFSKKPRAVYRYIIGRDSLIVSPESSVAIDACIVSGQEENYGPEFILNVSATGNYNEIAPYSDQYTWLILLNRDLKFLFDPVKISPYPSRLIVQETGTGKYRRLILLNEYFGDNDISSSICLYDLSGNKLNEKPISDFEVIYSNIFINREKNRESVFFLKNRKTEIDKLDTEFMKIRTYAIPPVATGIPLSVMDVDNNGEEEIIFQGNGRKTLLITSKDFTHYTEFDYNIERGEIEISQVLRKGNEPLLCLNANNTVSFLRYYHNPLYYNKYPAYVIVYFLIFFFISLIYRIQKYRMDLRQVIEKKIASLQIKAIKNQIDPHFTLNILNAIGSLYASDENRNNADYIFGKYAKLLRQTVISSDQIIIPLAEEIEFVRNYLDIERFRSNNSFEYNLELNPDVDECMKIPRTLIHTFVENAIKYGIRKKQDGGKINIVIQNPGKVLQIIIEDNGPGLGLNNKSGNGTGKGLPIINELIDLYYKLEKSKISYKLNTINIPGKIPSGTRVVIEIAL
jgi:hypothetical protein